MVKTTDRRSGKDRRDNVSLGRARGWIALAGMVVAGGGGAQLGKQHAETALTQDSAKMLTHSRDREVDSLRADMNHGFDSFDRRLARIEDRLPPR